MSPQAETWASTVDLEVDIDIIGSDESDGDVAIINRDDVSNYNPEHILPEPLEVISKIRKWIAPTDYNLESSEFRKHRASHMPGTGEWLFATPSYLKWHDGEDQGLLWIKGIPGSGKSVFAASLVDKLAQEGHPVLFFFFRQIIDANHKPVNLLRDWLDQILEYSPPLQVQLRAFVDEESGDKRTIDTINIDDLWNYLRMALAHMPRVYLVTDALDEMDKGNEEFLQALASLGSWKPATVKVIITSRPVNTVEQPVRKIPRLQIRLEEKLVDIDIATYVLSGINSSTIPEQDRLLIMEAIPGRANGLFLYAKLAMDAFLEPGADVHQVLQSLPADLNTMYTDLLRDHARRSDVPHDIQILILSWVTHATRPLRLLELAEFVRTTYEANDRQESIDIKTAKHLVRTACGPLLEILPDETVSVVHHSLTEFLNGSTRPYRAAPQDTINLDSAETGSGMGHSAHQFPPQGRIATSRPDPENLTNDTSWSTGDGKFPVLTAGATHECLAVCCLRYLLSGCLDGLQVETTPYWRPSDAKQIRYKTRRLEHASLTYASENWHVHVLKSEGAGFNPSSTLLSHLDEFLSREPILNAWLNISWYPEPTDGVTPYHIAARHGLTSYLGHLLSHGPETFGVDARDSYQRTPLFLAAGKGHAPAVKLLIDEGAEPDAEEREGLKPLHEAAKANHVEVVKVLLEAGVSPLTKKTQETPGRWCGNSPSSLGNTPLLYACEAGHLKVLEAFMPYLGDEAMDQALGWSSESGRSKLVTLILQSRSFDRVNINTRGRSAFVNACQNADIESMEALAGLGFILNMSDLERFMRGCSLMPSGPAYVYRPRPAELTVEDIKRGLDLFTVGGVPIDQINPHLASTNPLLLGLLLQAGADPDAEDINGGTLLHRSLEGEAGWDVVALLVEQGKADINRRRRGDGKTPVHAQIAGHQCHINNCIRFVQQYQPDCSLTDKNGEGPLSGLIKRQDSTEGRGWTKFCELDGFCELAEALVAAGASVHQRDHSGKCPIHYANVENVALLVRLGADINAQDYTGKTRLMYGVGDSEVALHLGTVDVKRVVDLGARLNLRDFQGRTALYEIQPGPGNRYRDVMSALIGLGMDPSAVDYSGNTLLHERAEGYKAQDDGTNSPFMAVLTHLMALGVDPNASNHAGQTILHILCTKVELEFTCRELLKCCDIESADNLGFRPIHLAAKKSELFVFLLISAGADVAATTFQGKTPLHCAAEAGKSNIVGMLIDALSSGRYGDMASIIDATDNSRHTALYYACKTGRPETVSLLLNAGKLGPENGNLGPKTHHIQTILDRGHHSAAKLAGKAVRGTKYPDILYALLGFEAPHPSKIYLPSEDDFGYRRERYYPRSSDLISQQQTSRLEEIIEMLMDHGLDFSNSKALPVLQEAIKLGRENHLDYVVRCMTKLLPETIDTHLDTSASESNTQKPSDLWETFSTRWHQLREQSSAVTFSETVPVSWALAGKADMQMRFLMEMLKQRQFDVVETVFRSTDFDALLPSGGETPLHALVYLGHAAILAKVATPEQVQTMTWTPLVFTACQRDLPNMDVLRVLVETFKASCDAHVRIAERAGCQLSDSKLGDSTLHLLAEGKSWWQVHQALPYLLSLPPGLRPDIEIKGSKGDTPLMRALVGETLYQRHGGNAFRWQSRNIFQKEAAWILVEAGANVNAKCLELAIAGGDLKLVGLLLQHGAVVTGTALAVAIEHNDADLMGLLLSTGADPNMRRNPHDVLLYMAAVKHEHAIVRQLLAHGADPFATFEPRTKSQKMVTVLHEIIREKGTVGPFFELLPNLDLEHPNEDGETVLLTTCKTPGAFSRMVKVQGEEEPFGEMLLERGANPRAVDKLNRNCLHLLMQSLQQGWWYNVSPLPYHLLKTLLTPGLAELLSQRADETTTHEELVDTSNTVLHCALRNVANQRFALPQRKSRAEDRDPEVLDDDDSDAIIELLLGGGSDPKAVNGEGNTALHILARGLEWRPASRRLFDTFLRLGVDINTANNAGETPLFIFMKGVVAPPWGEVDHETSPVILERKDEEAAWRVLTDNGADFQTRDHEGRCLLHAVATLGADQQALTSDAEFAYAVETKVGRFNRLVGEMGLDPFSPDNKMRTSIDVAVACGFDGIVELFKEGNER